LTNDAALLEIASIALVLEVYRLARLPVSPFAGKRIHRLFTCGCDDTWKEITDTWHETLQDAVIQAEFEYQGISDCWMRID